MLVYLLFFSQGDLVNLIVLNIARTLIQTEIKSSSALFQELKRSEGN